MLLFETKLFATQRNNKLPMCQMSVKVRIIEKKNMIEKVRIGNVGYQSFKSMVTTEPKDVMYVIVELKTYSYSVILLISRPTARV